MSAMPTPEQVADWILQSKTTGVKLALNLPRFSESDWLRVWRIVDEGVK